MYLGANILCTQKLVKIALFSTKDLAFAAILYYQSLSGIYFDAWKTHITARNSFWKVRWLKYFGFKNFCERTLILGF